MNYGVNQVLPDSFTPEPDHVICVRGTVYWHHPGNVKYRRLIEAALPRYSNATSRLQKSIIVSEIARAVDSWSLHSGFVKRSADGQCWMRCSSGFAREKISQSIRDGLQDQYKSSTKSKQRRCKVIKTRMSNGLETIVHSRQYVTDTYSTVRAQIRAKSPCSDHDAYQIFLEANCKLLGMIKEDAVMMDEYKKLYQSDKT